MRPAQSPAYARSPQRYPSCTHLRERGGAACGLVLAEPGFSATASTDAMQRFREDEGRHLYTQPHPSHNCLHTCIHNKRITPSRGTPKLCESMLDAFSSRVIAATSALALVDGLSLVEHQSAAIVPAAQEPHSSIARQTGRVLNMSPQQVPPRLTSSLALPEL